jgi:hypothetical protein
MTDRIRAGAMRIEDGTVTPKSLAFDTEQYSADRSPIVKPSAAQLDRELQSAEWTFFYMAGTIHVSGFGLNDRSRTDRAVAHAIKAVKLESCNCLGITQVRRGSFLGLPYTSLIAHARHIQKNRPLHNPPRPHSVPACKN